jgi:ADP-heptose:LPS heptosyltransferase
MDEPESAWAAGRAMKIFVWHQGALGDLILSLPSLWTIRRYFGDAAVHLFSRTDLSGILIKNELADEVFSHEKGLFADLFLSREALPVTLREFLAGFGAAFVFMRRPDDCFLKNLRRYIPRCFYICTVPPDNLRVHVSDFQRGALRDAGIRDDLAMPVLEASDGFSGFPSDKKIITIHPGSGGAKKCWPLERYLRLVSFLHAGNAYSFCILLGPAEGEDATKKIEQFICRKGIDAGIMRDDSLSAVAARLKKSSLYVGNDSGITHLSAALGTPTIALFGPTDYLKWGPRGNVRILHSDPACSPCGEDDRKRCVDVRCLKEVKMGGVISAARDFLNIKTGRGIPGGE